MRFWYLMTVIVREHEGKGREHLPLEATAKPLLVNNDKRLHALQVERPLECVTRRECWRDLRFVRR
jgi:hypothetical protein